MSLQNNLIIGTEFDQAKHSSRISLQQLSYSAVCSLMGILSGVLGVALTIALVISVQLWIFPLRPFWPDSIIILIFAVSFSAGFSWGVSKLVNLILPDFSIKVNGMKLMLIFATFTSLLQIFLFFPR